MLREPYLRADEAEPQVWEFVYGILTDPARLVHGLEKMMESERQPSAKDTYEASWVKRITEISVKQERLLDLHLNGDVTREQFRSKSAELERCSRCGGGANRSGSLLRLTRLKDIERSKEDLISHYASLMPQGLGELPPEERNRIYKMMRLHVFGRPRRYVHCRLGL